jgi:hypothetical protein
MTCMFNKWLIFLRQEYLWLYIPPKYEVLTDGSQTIVLVIFLIGQLSEERQEL